MPVKRTEKKNNFTIMSNEHLRDSRLSLKAKGLMSVILSLPDDWDYSVRGLAAIGRDSKDVVRSCIRELEQCGYVTRRRHRGKNGVLGGCDYFIYESPVSGNPTLDNPTLEKPALGNPMLENRPQLSTNISSTKVSSTHSIKESPKEIKRTGPAARRRKDDLCGYDKEHYRDKGLSDSGYETPEQARACKKEEEKEALRRYMEKNMVSGHKEQYIDFILNYKDILDDDYVPPEPPKQQAERKATHSIKESPKEIKRKGPAAERGIYKGEPHDQAFYDSIKGLLDM